MEAADDPHGYNDGILETTNDSEVHNSLLDHRIFLMSGIVRV